MVVGHVPSSIAPSPVTTAEIAAWLGLEPGETVTCRVGACDRPDPTPAWLTGSQVAICLALLLLNFVSMIRTRGTGAEDGSLLAGVFLGGGLLALLCYLEARLERKERVYLLASGAELSFHDGKHWRRYAWSEVRRIETDERTGGWRVTLGGLVYDLSPRSQGGRVAGAIQRALACQRLGRPLPPGGPPPNGAISVAGRRDGPQEGRGISRVQRESEP